MSSEFRNQMIRAVCIWEEHSDGTAGYSTDEADAILAMPEMDEIKRILSSAMTVLGYDDDPIEQQAKIAHLREAVEDAHTAVIDWALGDPS
jgi:hypothetical protein